MSDGRGIGTLVGAVAGFFTGGASWVGLGAALGGVVGGLLEPKKRTETNRIDDVKVSVSKYGDGIPETWGNNIPQATCVWSTYIIQMPEKQSSGKGGGAENTNYRQFIQSMWCLGRTPPPGSTVAIRKVWIDGKLNYDSSSGLSIGQALATKENPWASLVLLPGFDGQLPVPMIETYEGMGNVPAFLGRICVFIFGLECPGGRVPQLQFELCVNPSITPTITPGQDFVIPPQSVGGFPMHSHVGGLPITLFTQDSVSVSGGSHKSVTVYALGDDYLTRVRTLTLESAAGAHALPGAADIDAICQAWPDVNGNDRGELAVIEATGGVHILQVGVGFKVYLPNGLWAKWTDRVAVAEDFSGTDRVALFDYETGALLAMATAPDRNGMWITAGGVFLRYQSGASWHIEVRSRNDLSLIDSKPLPAALSGMFFVSPGEAGLFVVPPGTMDVWFIDEAGDARFVESGVGTPSGNSINPILIDSGKVLGWNGVAAAAHIYLVDLDVLEPTEASVADIIESQSTRAGLTLEQIDTSEVSDTFWGMTMKSPASARSNIAPLLTYSALGVVEEDGLLRYFVRGNKTPVATIQFDELGQAEAGSDPAEAFPLTRANAQELPCSMTLSYNDPLFDYQQSTVKAMRYAVDTVSDETTSLDMAISGDRAATIVQRLLLERWVAQMTRSASVSRKYAFLSAGDVITVLSKTGSFGNFMISKCTDTGALIQIECFPADAELLTQTVPGPAGFQAQQIEPLATPTLAIPIDTSILRDQDSNAGLYFAMAGYGPNYPGGELFTGPDEGSLSSRGQVVNEASVGVSETLLGGWSANVVDETNVITVDMGHHELSSITRDVLLSGTSNVAAIGAPGRWELIKFQRAVDLGGGRYLLSGFLRGVRGTEHAAGKHKIGDQFVIMGVAGMLRPNFDTGEVGQAQLFRAITLGRSFNSVASQSFSNSAEGLKPFAPVNLRKALIGNDIVLTWSRRTRLSENAFAGILPLGEASEQYDVTIFSDSSFATVKRVIRAYTQSATYTAADQAADFGSTQATINVRVQQRSDTIGLGHELQATA